MIVHGYMCKSMMDTVLIPIIKDKKGDISTKDNYRPIAIATVFSKLFEVIILSKYECYLSTTSNQFGFKPNHSTDMCSFVLKNVIDYYTTLSSPVFICYVDASKAFDRVNFWVLFDKLIARNIPIIIVRLLAYWYTHQHFLVQWGNCFSQAFSVKNSVRQGGVLSPYLFNVYTDDLSEQLSNSKIGCYFNDVLVNHLMYADDAVLIAPSASGLQTLLLICEKYASLCDILFNERKTVCMCVKPKCFKQLVPPEILLNGKPLKYVHRQKYLGIIVDEDQRDDCDMNNQLRNLYARGNLIIKNFKNCSVEIKCLLFKAYCTNIYCCQLWHSFNKESLRRLKVAYNRIFRILFGLEHRTSMSAAFIEHDVAHFNVLLRKTIYGFKCRLLKSSNFLIQTVFNAMFFTRSKLFNTWCDKLYK